MQKPASLRAALAAAYPQLARDAERLSVWVEEGRIRSPMTASRGFTWEYTLNITLTEMTGDPSVLFLAINDWCRTNQPDLLTPEAKSGYTFEADLIDTQTVDLHITLRLTEQVAVTTDANGNTQIQYLPEPDMSWLLGEPGLTTPTVGLTSLVAQLGTPPTGA